MTKKQGSVPHEAYEIASGGVKKAPPSKRRAASRAMDQAYPSSEKILAMPNSANPLTAVNQVREGSLEVANIPWLLPVNRRKLARDYASFRENRLDRYNQEEMRQYKEKLIEAASDPEAKREVAAYREFELVSDVMAIPWTLGTFQAVNLSAEDLPLLTFPRSRNLQRFNVRSVGIDGGTFRDQWRTTKSIEQILMEMVSTDRVEYTLNDLQQGNVNESDRINAELQYDMEMHIDGLGKTNIDAAKVESGLRDSLSIHPSIDPLNIPDKNYLDLNGVDTAGKLSIGKLKTILEHVSKFGAAGGADEAISIQTIMMSPQNIRDPWDFIDLVSGFTGGEAVEPSQTVTPGVRESIFNTGMMTSAWGHTFSWTPNAQLSVGKMYILTSQPLGWYFTKTDFDKVIEWNESNSPDHADNNMGEIVWKKALRFFVPDLWRYRIVIVDL